MTHAVPPVEAPLPNHPPVSASPQLEAAEAVQVEAPTSVQAQEDVAATLMEVAAPPQVAADVSPKPRAARAARTTKTVKAGTAARPRQALSKEQPMTAKTSTAIKARAPRRTAKAAPPKGLISARHMAMFEQGVIRLAKLKRRVEAARQTAQAQASAVLSRLQTLPPVKAIIARVG